MSRVAPHRPQCHTRHNAERNPTHMVCSLIHGRASAAAVGSQRQQMPNGYVSAQRFPSAAQRSALNQTELLATRLRYRTHDRGPRRRHRCDARHRSQPPARSAHPAAPLASLSPRGPSHFEVRDRASLRRPYCRGSARPRSRRRSTPARLSPGSIARLRLWQAAAQASAAHQLHVGARRQMLRPR